MLSQTPSAAFLSESDADGAIPGLSAAFLGAKTVLVLHGNVQRRICKPYGKSIGRLQIYRNAGVVCVSAGTDCKSTGTQVSYACLLEQTANLPERQA